MADAKTERDFVPSGFFAFRTPFLPYEELEAWAAGLSAAAAGNDPERLAAAPERLAEALAADRALLRSRLAGFLERPEVREALFLASPSLFDGLDAWRADPESKKGGRAERALVRYLLRMAARPTPFGLFSGCTTGELGAETRLRLLPNAAYQRHTRLDMDYLFALAEALAHDPAVRATCSTARTPASTGPPAACATPRRGSTARRARTTWWRSSRPSTWRTPCAEPRTAPAPPTSPRRSSPRIPTARSSSRRRKGTSPSSSRARSWSPTWRCR